MTKTNTSKAVERTALTKDAILKYNDVHIVEVSTPEWGKGAFVYVRGLTGSERDWFESTLSAESENVETFKNFRAKLCCKVICNKDGKTLFNTHDIQALGSKNARPIDRIFSKGMEISGIDKDAVDTAEDFFDETQGSENGIT